MRDHKTDDMGVFILTPDGVEELPGFLKQWFPGCDAQISWHGRELALRPGKGRLEIAVSDMSWTMERDDTFLAWGQPARTMVLPPQITELFMSLEIRDESVIFNSGSTFKLFSLLSYFYTKHHPQLFTNTGSLDDRWLRRAAAALRKRRSMDNMRAVTAVMGGVKNE